MKICIFVPYIGNFGQKGFYNSQEMGIAKSLVENGLEVVVFKLHDKRVNGNIEEDINENLKVIDLPAKRFGTHGIINLNIIDKHNFDLILLFSDIQLITKSVYSLCVKRKIKLINYIGVLESNSNSFIKRTIAKLLSIRNLKVYRKSICLAKTPKVTQELLELGAINSELMPVALDFDLLNSNYEKTDRNTIKEEFNIRKDEKVVLFVGRLEEEKRPIVALEIFSRLLSNNEKFKFIIIGKGTMKNKVLNYINENKLTNKIIYIDSIPNNEMWKVYHISDIFINLSNNEIFGMAILEAMYYKCAVIAKSAPGPNYIIKNEVNGIILDNYDIDRWINEIINISVNSQLVENAYNTIKEEFNWSVTAKKILRYL